MSWDAWIFQDLGQLLLELLANGVAQLVPFHQRTLIELKAIGHPAKP